MGRNKEIILTIGVPGSGKTTFVQEFISNHPKYVRVSRDDVRLMMKNEKKLDRKGEDLVTNIMQEQIKNCIRAGYNVIVDQTNTKKRSLEDFTEWCRQYADVDFWVFDVAKDKLLERNKTREYPVPEEVIERMHQSFTALLDSNFDFNKRLKKESTDVVYDEDPDLPHCVIFDVDGTLAKMQNRGPFDWDHVDQDRPNWPVVKMCRDLKAQGNTIIIFTGRDGSALDKTIEWLDFYEIPYDEIYIRPENNFEKDWKIKKRMFEDNIQGRYYVDYVVDDRDQVVEMWRDEIGLTCVQVDRGNF